MGNGEKEITTPKSKKGKYEKGKSPTCTLPLISEQLIIVA